MIARRPPLAPVRRIALALLLVLVPAVQTGAQIRSGEPPVSLSPDALIDFGFLMPGEIAERSFTLRNEGDIPLTVGRLHVGCPCLTVTTDATVIQPGETARFNVQMEAGFVLTESRKAISVQFEEYSGAKWATCLSTWSYYVNTSIPGLNLDRERSGVIKLVSIDGEPFRILSAGGAPPVFTDSTIDQNTPAVEWEIAYDFTRSRGSAWFIIETDHAISPVVPLPVYAREVMNAERAFQRKGLKSYRGVFNLGHVRPGDTFEFAFEAGVPEYAEKLSLTSQDESLVLAKLENTELVRGRRYRLSTTMRIPETDQRGLFIAPIHLNATDEYQTRMYVIGKLIDPKTSAAHPAN